MSRKTYRYLFHGLRIASQLELAELASEPPISSNEPPDVTIAFDAVPVELTGNCSIVEDYQVQADKIILTVPSVGRFLAQAGQKLTIEPAPDASLNDLKIFAIGSGMAAILHQRKLVPLHACGIEYNGACVAFMGASGVGKSTLAAMLSKRGHQLVSDDVLVVRPQSNGTILAEPSLPIMKLWPQSLDVSGLKGDKQEFESPNYHKFRIADPGRFSRLALPVKQLYILRWLLPVSAEPELVSLGGSEAIVAIRSNIYRPRLVEALKNESGFFALGASLLKQARVFEFRRPADLDDAEEQVDMLLDNIEQTDELVD